MDFNLFNCGIRPSLIFLHRLETNQYIRYQLTQTLPLYCTLTSLSILYLRNLCYDHSLFKESFKWGKFGPGKGIKRQGGFCEEISREWGEK